MLQMRDNKIVLKVNQAWVFEDIIRMTGISRYMYTW